MRQLLAASMLALLLPGLALAQPQDAERQLDAVRELVMRARFADAVRSARTYLDRTDLNAYDRNAGLEVLATAQIANREPADAEQTLLLLYSRDPGHRLTDADASPPVISAFARARESHPQPVPVRIEHTPPRLTERAPPELRVSLPEGADAVSEVQLTYRIAGEGSSRVVMTRRDDGAYTARIPVVGDAASATDVAYFIVAMAPSLTPLASRGSAAEPLQLQIPAESSTGSDSERPPVFAQPVDTTPTTPEEGGGSVIEEWWFWTLIVALVAGGVTVGVVLGTQQSPEEGTLGSVRLMQIEW
ncbi:MAG: hypothetical protein H6719_09560 [Sandaracinaceae bacterium]|nr:hypothetical protein [Sandaracinaceae bacterium]